MKLQDFITEVVETINDLKKLNLKKIKNDASWTEWGDVKFMYKGEFKDCNKNYRDIYVCAVKDADLINIVSYYRDLDDEINSFTYLCDEFKNPDMKEVDNIVSNFSEMLDEINEEIEEERQDIAEEDYEW